MNPNHHAPVACGQAGDSDTIAASYVAIGNSLLSWLSNHKRFSAVLALVYLAVNVITHDNVQGIARWIQDRLTPAGINTLVTIVALATVPLFIVLIVVRLRRHPNKLLIGLYCAATAGLVLMSYTTMLMINMESIHFPQYALLAVLVFAITPRFGETILLVTILGAIDESHQYWVLDRDADLYLDFNDIVLNLEGAAIGVLLLALLVRPNPSMMRNSTYSLSKFIKSPACVVAVGIGVITMLLCLFDVVALYSESGAWIVLRRIGPPSGDFWFKSYWGKTCHVLMPVQGIMMLMAMTVFSVLLDFRLTLELKCRALSTEC